MNFYQPNLDPFFFFLKSALNAIHLSLSNSRFGNYMHFIYPNEIEVKDTTDTQKYASYLDLELEVNNG